MLRLIVSILVFTFFAMSTYALETINTTGISLPLYTPITPVQALSPLNVKIIRTQINLQGLFDRVNNEYKIIIPHDELQVVSNGMRVTPEMGLTSLITFKKINNQASMSADIILLQDQVNPVMTVALQNNLQVMNLHSPFLWDSPRVMLMHVKADGDEYKIAKAVKKVLAEMKRTENGNGDFPYANSDDIITTLNPKKLNFILGEKAILKNDAYDYVFRQDKNKINASAVFSGSDNNAVVEGSLTLRLSDLQETLIALRKAQFFITAIYEHSIEENTSYTVHYWGIGQSQALAKALHTAFIVAQQDNKQFKVSAPVNSIIMPLVQKGNCNPILWTKQLASISAHPIKEIKEQKNLSTISLQKLNQSVKYSHHTNYFHLWVANASRMWNIVHVRMQKYSQLLQANISKHNLIPISKDLPVVEKKVIHMNKSNHLSVISGKTNNFINQKKLSMNIVRVLNIGSQENGYRVSGDLLYKLISLQNKNFDHVGHFVQVSPVIFHAKSNVVTVPKQVVMASPLKLIDSTQINRAILQAMHVIPAHVQQVSVLYAIPEQVQRLSVLHVILEPMQHMSMLHIVPALLQTQSGLIKHVAVLNSVPKQAGEVFTSYIRPRLVQQVSVLHATPIQDKEISVLHAMPAQASDVFAFHKTKIIGEYVALALHVKNNQSVKIRKSYVLLNKKQVTLNRNVLSVHGDKK